MPPPSKRKLHCRKAASAAAACKRARIGSMIADNDAENSREPSILTLSSSRETPVSETFDINVQSEAEMSGAWPQWSEAEDSDSANEEEEEEQDDSEENKVDKGDQKEEEQQERMVLRIGQPVGGWKLAENSLLSSNASLSSTRKARWSRKERARKKKEKEEEAAVTLRSTYGDISRFFVTDAPQPELPPNFIAPNFNKAPGCAEIAEDIVQLELWIKKNKLDMTSQWGLRVDSLLRLLKIQQARYQGVSERKLIDDSMTIALSINKGKKYAKALRRWTKEWHQSRTPPPKSRKGKHIKSETLYEDEGVLVSVREYLNRASWKVTPKGVCDTVAQFLGSRKAAGVMKIVDVLANADKEPKDSSISIRTAQRWLGKLGWIWSRNRKGYVDGHEREDVVKYRETVFLPQWLKIRPSLREWIDDEPTVLAGLESVSLRTIQRFANRSTRWIESYINGLNEKQKAFVDKQEGSHRRGMGQELVDVP